MHLIFKIYGGGTQPVVELQFQNFVGRLSYH